jgi:tetratricopeptide (TPR) repeat protein
MLRGGDGAEEGRFSLGDLSSGESPAIDLSAEFSNEEPIAEAIADAELAVPATPEEAFDLSDFGTSVEPQPPVVAPIVAPKPTAKPMAKPVVKPATKKDQHQSELDEIEFFISQGLHDEAVDLVKSILEISPQHPQALAFAADLGLNQPEKKTPPPQPTASPKPIAKPVFKSEPTEEIPFSAEMERPQGDSLHLEGESEIAGQDGFFDLADELKEEIHNLNAGPGQPSDDEPLSFDEVFSAFKKGVQETVSEDETEAHYNLGIAYKEMGLMDDAISEFRIALKDIRLSVDACSLIGICYREMGRFKESAASFMKAIDSLAVGDERVMALKYDLADTQVAAGELREALASFKEVYNINQSFRDVSHRMKELAEGLEGGVVDENLDQSKDTKKKSKISYL